MSLTESDKVVLTKYPIAPSKCVVCLRSSNGQLNFIDFQMSLDIYGSVNICVDCVRSVAPLVGLVAGELLEGADEQIRNLVESNRKLIADNERLNSTLDSLVGLRPNLIERDLPVDEGSSESVESDDSQLELELAVEGNDNRKSAKSNAGRGPKNSAFITDEGGLTFNI
jgi:hypothetical protein